MITSFRQEEAVKQPIRAISMTPIAVLLGTGCGFMLSWLWPMVTGLAAWALWPLGMAIGLIGVTLFASLLVGQTHWELLIIGKLFAVLGAFLLFLSSLGI